MTVTPLCLLCVEPGSQFSAFSVPPATHWNRPRELPPLAPRRFFRWSLLGCFATTFTALGVWYIYRKSRAPAAFDSVLAISTLSTSTLLVTHAVKLEFRAVGVLRCVVACLYFLAPVHHPPPVFVLPSFPPVYLFVFLFSKPPSFSPILYS